MPTPAVAGGDTSVQASKERGGHMISPGNDRGDEPVTTLGSRPDFEVWASTVVAVIEALRRTEHSSQVPSHFAWAR